MSSWGFSAHLLMMSGYHMLLTHCTMSKLTSAVSVKVMLQAMCFSSVTVEMLLEPC